MTAKLPSFSLNRAFAAATLAVALPLAGLGSYFYLAHDAPQPPAMATTYDWRETPGVTLTAPALNDHVDWFCDQNTIRSVALLVVDIQGEFCDTQRGPYTGSPETELVAERAQSLVPEFRRAAIPVYMIYYDLETGDPDFYKVAPARRDILIEKNADSAFDGSDIDRQLRQRGHDILLVCGVNRDFCVKETVLDALDKGYKVYVLSDITGSCYTGNAERDLKRLKDKGAIITTSGDILRAINAVNFPPPPPPPPYVPDVDINNFFR